MAVLWQNENIRKTKIETIQINMGNRCNQACAHCHIEASPRGRKNMEEATAERILGKLLELDIENVEFTGGAPELNPNLKMFIERVVKNHKKIVVRTNLTVLDMPEYSFFIDLYKRYGVKIVASLPSCFEDMTDRQRGRGVFNKSVTILKKLNEIGYGGSELSLELVYNPAGDYLPPSQTELERDYKKLLTDNYGISFNSLITITNSPIGGFRKSLIRQGKFDDYMSLLVNNFNYKTLDSIMCRRLLSVDYQGYVYDCDFNLALGIRVKGYEDKRLWDIDFEDFNPEITCDEHCYACTVGRGSSCHGVLIKENEFDARETVKQYYGIELKRSSDLKAGVCCSVDSMPSHIKEVMPYIAEEIKEKYYGCGSPFPLMLRGLTVLDLGCGTGRDCYIFSKFVSESGFVYGIDMTENQIEVALKHVVQQTKRLGYEKPNVKFIFDYIENLGRHFKEESLDLVVSNCVVNLVEDKESVLRQVYRALKFGGEFYFSDIYADRRLPDDLRTKPVLYGECLGGALYWRDFERISKRVGFSDPRIVSKKIMDISNEEIKGLVENITFYSITYRLWKLKGLEDACEDYGHVATYRGGISESPFKFVLDAAHVFEIDRPERVCGNTALMLSQTRFRDYFEVTGDFEKHFGEFKNCSTIQQQRDYGQEGSSCC
ncbi:MAG: arsenosugar biosynthesis radical SAM (seleno)protein ArsS [Nitrospirota bacterium]